MSEKINIFEFLTPKAATNYLYSDCTVRQALEKFDVHKFTVVPVIDKQGNYINTISEGDLLRFIKNENNLDFKKAENRFLDEVERYRSYQCLDINCSISEILALSLSQNFIPLIDDRNKYIGIIRRKDVIQYIVSKRYIAK